MTDTSLEGDRGLTGAQQAVAGNVEMMQALVAAYALMAHADGEVATAERRRIFSILRESPGMTAVSQDAIGDEIAAHEANFRYDPELAQQIAREKLVPAARSRRAAARIVATCRELIPADGVAHPSEYRALADIKAMLGFDDSQQNGALRSVSATQW